MDNTYLTLYLPVPTATRAGGVGARIRYDSLKETPHKSTERPVICNDQRAIDPQRSAKAIDPQRSACKVTQNNAGHEAHNMLHEIPRRSRTLKGGDR